MAKLTLVLFLASYFQNPKHLIMTNWVNLLIPSGVSLFTFLLILRQPDLGTAGNLLIIALILLFFAGLHRKLIILASLFFVVCLPFVWSFILKDYQKNRILTLLNPERDPLGKGYHIIQSKIAIGSGGLWGKGFLKGTQAHLNFLPARYTDFILSVFAEEMGLIGCLILFALYVAIIFLSLRNITELKNSGAIFLIVGITSLLSTQILINIAMVLGVFPVVGMPLPWMSYGGTAILADMISMALILNVRMRNF